LFKNARLEVERCEILIVGYPSSRQAGEVLGRERFKTGPCRLQTVRRNKPAPFFDKGKDEGVSLQRVRSDSWHTREKVSGPEGVAANKERPLRRLHDGEAAGYRRRWALFNLWRID